MTKAEEFVEHMMKRVQRDGRLAWLIGPLSESYELMTDAYGEMHVMEGDKVREQYGKTLNPERWPSS